MVIRIDSMRARGEGTMKTLETADSTRYRTLNAQELREAFLLSDLFRAGEIDMVYVDLDRAVVGSAVPVDKPLALATYDALKADYFTERRELGVLNIGGAGAVVVDGTRFEVGRLDALYIGRGSRGIHFESADPRNPAEFYLLSYPAHAPYPTRLIRSSEQKSDKIGSSETANERQITRLIHVEGVRSCQLVMGFTRLAKGSVWNTMPAHTHSRRSEIYFYFDLPADQRVIHLMGPARETRHLVIANKQAVVSPGWSIHSGVGTSCYSFCWGMGGENQVYSDMDKLAIADL
jgi:4-deoxy-L-threo-5-hexosulose-uronate ketol-isomerase